MQKELLLAKKIVSIAKKYSPLHKISVIEVSLPSKYEFDVKALKSIFSTMKITLKVSKGNKLKVIAIEERY